MDQFCIETLAGVEGRDLAKSMARGMDYLNSKSDRELLDRVGEVIPGVALSKQIDKAVMPDSYFGGKVGPTDDFLVGKGAFYITEQGRLFLDCTAGHYQMTWGYHHPRLVAACIDAIQRGVTWDNHSNIPQWPVKRLAQKLIEVANPDRPVLKSGDFSAIIDEPGRLNVAMVGIATGSVACETALKVALNEYKRKKTGIPVMVVLNGNYHGTGISTQMLRGMWDGFIQGMDVVSVEPNDPEQLEGVFRTYGERIAAFWAESVMMNREAIYIKPEYMRLARELTSSVGALVIIDEIQTGFWVPEVLMYKQYGITPDVVVVGKGLTAGLHPLSGVLMRNELDTMAQYDAISTNGNAALASYIALSSIAMIEEQRERVASLGSYYFGKLEQIAADFPDTIQSANGLGYMGGLKFHSVDTAMSFFKQCMETGLWLRIHAYHPGHSTILTKFALCADTDAIDYLVSRLRAMLQSVR